MLASLVPEEVSGSLRDVDPVAQAPVPLTDRELSRRFTELTDKKTTLEAKLGKHKGQVEKARRHLRVEEERMQGLERELLVFSEVEEVWDQLVRPRATKVLEGMDEDLGRRGRGRRAGGKLEEFWQGGSGGCGKVCIEGRGQEEEKI